MTYYDWYNTPQSWTINPGHIDIYLNKYDMNQSNFLDIMKTFAATHELGHALGLAHSGPKYCDSTPSGTSIMEEGSEIGIIGLLSRALSSTKPLAYDRQNLVAF